MLSSLFTFIGVLGDCIEVYGDWLPRQILGKGTAFCAILRMIYLSIILVIRHFLKKIWKYLSQSNEIEKVELVFVDGVSAPMPFYSLAGIPSIFYCHFPDKVSLIPVSKIFLPNLIPYFLNDTISE